jgi:hypothetical protein
VSRRSWREGFATELDVGAVRCLVNQLACECSRVGYTLFVVGVVCATLTSLIVIARLGLTALVLSASPPISTVTSILCSSSSPASYVSGHLCTLSRPTLTSHNRIASITNQRRPILSVAHRLPTCASAASSRVHSLSHSSTCSWPSTAMWIWSTETPHGQRARPWRAARQTMGDQSEVDLVLTTLLLSPKSKSNSKPKILYQINESEVASYPCEVYVAQWPCEVDAPMTPVPPHERDGTTRTPLTAC